MSPIGEGRRAASVVIPAHNEEPVIGRLLRALLGQESARHLEVIVVANGCIDRTAATAEAVAAEFAGSAACVDVISISEASKQAALRAGDDRTNVFPRVWIDADVVVGADDVQRLCRSLETPGVHAAAPRRILELTGRPRLVRWYYDVWERLPEVASGLFGRGAIAMTAEGHARVKALPPVMGDDLLASLAFEPSERIVVDEARVVVHTPRTVVDLLRRRVRVATSSAHVEREVPREHLATRPGKQAGARTRPSDLVYMVRGEPRLAPKLIVFLAMATVARWCSSRAIRRRDFTTWLRDDSSRTGSDPASTS